MKNPAFFLFGFYVASCSQSICSTDTDCPSTELCLESKCTGSCVSDNDCPGTYVCEASQCMNPYSLSPRTAVETFDGFRAALQVGGLELAVSYVSPHVRELFRAALSEMDSAKLNQIPALTPDMAVGEEGQFKQYEVDINGEKYGVTFNCEHDYCQINGF